MVFRKIALCPALSAMIAKDVKMNLAKLPKCIADLIRITEYYMGGSLKRSLGMANYVLC
jgi:hypothetical protein